MTFGIDTFGDVTVDADGRRLSAAQVLRNVVEEAVLAEQVGGLLEYNDNPEAAEYFQSKGSWPAFD